MSIRGSDLDFTRLMLSISSLPFRVELRLFPCRNRASGLPAGLQQSDLAVPAGPSSSGHLGRADAAKVAHGGGKAKDLQRLL